MVYGACREFELVHVCQSGYFARKLEAGAASWGPLFSGKEYVLGRLVGQIAWVVAEVDDVPCT